MQHFFSLLLKGFVIGIGKIIPGVSGSMLAISFGLYEELVHAIGTFFKNIRKNLSLLLPVGIGIMLAIVLMSGVIHYFLNSYYLPTMLLFIGLIVGCIPAAYQKTTSDKSTFFLIFVVFLSIFCFTFVKETKELTSPNLFTLLLIGFIDAATMIIPGISGTAILMILGYYNFFLSIFYSFQIRYFIPYLIGLIVGIIFVSKWMDFCFQKFPKKMYALILGLVFSSVFLLFLQTLQKNYTIMEIIVGLFLFIIGLSVAKRLEK